MCDVTELSSVFSDAKSLQSFLQRIAEMVVDHMQSEVCSIYLYDDLARELILKATSGLLPSAIDKVKLEYGEGLTGMALKEMRPICEKNASQNRFYRYFPDIGEELYESFLAVPLLRGHIRIGVLVIQNSKKNYFQEEDIQAFQVVASQLANTLETAKILISLHAGSPPPKKEAPEAIKLVKGRQAVAGFALGEVVTWKQDRISDIPHSGKVKHKYRFEDVAGAVEKSQIQLQKAQKRVEEKLSDAASLIFTAQILMLKDDAFISLISQKMKEGAPAPSAIIQAVEIFIQKFEAIEVNYLREKKYDMIDIGKRLLTNIMGIDERQYSLRRKIVIAQELYPSTLLKLSAEEIAGIVILTGGVTSHVSILAQSLGIPVVICEEPRLLSLPPKTIALLDGEQGNVHINPTEEILRQIKERDKAKQAALKIRGAVHERTFTKDKQPVKLLANINLLGDLKGAREVMAEGIGLYRTEFPFIIRSNFPTEEEQFVIYRKLVEGMRGKEITFRTLDIGGDKVLSYYDYGNEQNPFMGMRSIRFSLRHKDIFRQQLRAILRAGKGEDLRIMFPMISSLDEFLDAKAEVQTCIDGLKKQGVPCNPAPVLGMMVELPAVVELAEDFAQIADFFSIGTNDFIQYMLAVDRTNEKVSDLYMPFHPSVLRALEKIVSAARAHKKDVSICGQMAQDERYVNFFLGIGIRKFSLDVTAMARIQECIENTDVADAVTSAKEFISKKYTHDLKEMCG